jgi:hypothetical protein
MRGFSTGKEMYDEIAQTSRRSRHNIAKLPDILASRSRLRPGKAAQKFGYDTLRRKQYHVVAYSNSALHSKALRECRRCPMVENAGLLQKWSSSLLAEVLAKSQPPQEHPDVLTKPWTARADVRAFLLERSKVLLILLPEPRKEYVRNSRCIVLDVWRDLSPQLAIGLVEAFCM